MRSEGRQRRKKARKPRFASLRRKLARSASTHLAADHQQLDLFPLLPEPICHDRGHDHHVDHRDRDHEDDDKEGNYVAKFFDLECDTLNSILGSTVDPEQDARPPLESTSEKLTPRGGLARKALKGRERWEFCNEEGEGEGSNGAGGAGAKDAWWDTPRRKLRLKLDYEEIMTAWSDKGPLFVDGEGAQVVPQSHPQHLYDSTTSVFVDVGGGNNSSCSSSSNLWAVPENGEGSGGGDREARVMRYKEKRQSRLFSRKIRYEVRKLNAEKRPRIKGRFVKRLDGDG